MFTTFNEFGQTENKRLLKAHQKMAKLIAALEKKEVPEAIVDEINIKIANLNAASRNEKEYTRELDRAYQGSLKLLQEKLNWIPRDFYRDQWMAVGLSVFGVPLGVVLGAALDNMAFMAVFMPVGMVIGMGIGTEMDKKATEEGRVLEF